MTLTDFLLARIAEDEAAVLDGWDSDARARVAVMWTGGEPGYTVVASDRGDDEWVADGRVVISPRHVQVLLDPARVLAECEAKRRIVAEHPLEFPVKPGQWDCATCGHIPEEWRPNSCPTLRALALPYADHPDFRAEWRA